jgi:cathepsin B
MRILISILLIFAVSSELINQGTWVSNTNGPFANMTVAQMKRYMGGSVDLTHVKKSDIVVDLEAIPTNFDPRTVWPDCIHPILDQEQCGSCWAFGASESFSDRICIQTNGSVNVVLSPENLVSCDFVC